MSQPTASNVKRFYLAATGMITPVGGKTTTTAAAVNAHVSAYSLSEYYNRHFQPVKITSIPSAVFAQQGIDTANWSGSHQARLASMASIAIEEACAVRTIKEPIPLILAMPEVRHEDQSTLGADLIKHLVKKHPALINPSWSRVICSGRAAGMDALAFAFDYLYDIEPDYILVGGSDSYLEDQRLQQLDDENRLLTEAAGEGFAPGEAAGFLLLTRNPEQALTSNGHVIVLNSPGVADEPGHLYSDKPYRGEGLDHAFKKALANYSGQPIQRIYSSMNGEHCWAKEYGVAFMRNKNFFVDPVKFEHPADCYGDIGSATTPVLIALAAHHLLASSAAHADLVYSSSDAANRGAIVLEKLPLHNDIMSKRESDDANW